MGKRGPAPRPSRLRLIEGARRDKVNQAEPVPRDLPPECPEDASPAVRDIWDFTVGELAAMKIAYRCDRDTLRCYCEAVVNHRKASALLARTDVLVKGLKNRPVRNPALAVQRDSAGVIRAFAQEFGLTPSARARIEVRDIPDADVNPFAGTR